MATDKTSPVNDTDTDSKLEKLERARIWSPRTISRLESLIRSGDDYSLFRINPVAYAAEKGLDENEAIDLFLHGTAAGLFTMNWNLLCPGCTSVVESFATLRNLDCRYHCEICNVNFEAQLDDYIQISFTVSPDVRRIAFHDPDKLATLDHIVKYRFAREGIIKADGAKWMEKVAPLVRHWSALEPGAETRCEVNMSSGYIIINDLMNHLGIGLAVAQTNGGTTGKTGVVLNPATIDVVGPELSAGRGVFEFRNNSGKKGLVTVLNLPPDYKETMAIGFTPFLSGKRLLTSQTFRELFHYEVVKGTESLGVKNIAILFTDLKGSTSLYERIGDLKAFSLVRQHFDILGKVIAKNSGAIVKTIGDAVMASFMNPAQAAKAAVEMLREVETMNSFLGGKDIILKVGLHSGASIVVNLNERLDYFGQTVNIASRVQNLAASDEIFLTSEVYEFPGVKDALGTAKVEAQTARLKGLNDEMRVYKISF